jgi:hypothetical protein
MWDHFFSGTDGFVLLRSFISVTVENQDYGISSSLGVNPQMFTQVDP